MCTSSGWIDRASSNSGASWGTGFSVDADAERRREEGGAGWSGAKGSSEDANALSPYTPRRGQRADADAAWYGPGASCDAENVGWLRRVVARAMYSNEEAEEEGVPRPQRVHAEVAPARIDDDSERYADGRCCSNAAAETRAYVPREDGGLGYGAGGGLSLGEGGSPAPSILVSPEGGEKTALFAAQVPFE